MICIEVTDYTHVVLVRDIFGREDFIVMSMKLPENVDYSLLHEKERNTGVFWYHLQKYKISRYNDSRRKKKTNRNH